MKGNIFYRSADYYIRGTRYLNSLSPGYFGLNPLTAGNFIDFGLVIRGQSVTQRSTGCNTVPLLVVKDYRKVKFPERDNSYMAVKGLKT